MRCFLVWICRTSISRILLQLALGGSDDRFAGGGRLVLLHVPEMDRRCRLGWGCRVVSQLYDCGLGYLELHCIQVLPVGTV
ncbi:hypothetical protein M758_8G159800 [Ceratodon purpureus]|nr:hypothetical protein M758_8G159800 [Ceratodon purpureus]